jgi:hypothetical protein
MPHPQINPPKHNVTIYMPPDFWEGVGAIWWLIAWEILFRVVMFVIKLCPY